MNRISVIIPALNEAEHIRQTLQSTRNLYNNGHEVIVVDGGSNDDTCKIASEYTDKLITCQPGRAIQMNRGADAATGEIYVFLHADTILPEDAEELILSAISTDRCSWGSFNVRLSGYHILFRVIEFFMNLRTRITGIVTGDQTLWIGRKLFDKTHGFPDIQLMEDIAISRKLKKFNSPKLLNGTVLTSSRRWEQNGILKTVLKMWWLRLNFMLGVEPHLLARQYD